MPATNSIGQRGEKAVETSFCRPSGNVPEYQFRPIPLGDKAELFDFVVHLLDANDNILGAHFFVQVKRRKQLRDGNSCDCFLRRKIYKR